MVKKRHEVDKYIWEHPDYCIQRYVNNDDFVTFRAIYHMGNIVVFVNRIPRIVIKKWMRDEERYFHPTTETQKAFDLAREVARLSKYDFFTLDMVMDNHRNMSVIDLNTTPSWSKKGYPQDILKHLLGEK
jgi:hypothetical protein